MSINPEKGLFKRDSTCYNVAMALFSFITEGFLPLVFCASIVRRLNYVRHVGT